jgi:hypothetical protein
VTAHSLARHALELAEIALARPTSRGVLVNQREAKGLALTVRALAERVLALEEALLAVLDAGMIRGELAKTIREALAAEEQA